MTHHDNTKPPWRDGYYNGFHITTRKRAGDRQNNAFRKGTVPRPSTCMNCHQTDGIVMAHLEDYDAPYDYLPMCYCCHKALHARYDYPGVYHAHVEKVAAGYRTLPFTTYDWRTWNRLIRHNNPADWGYTRTDQPGDITLFEQVSMTYVDNCPEHLAISLGAEHLPGQHRYQAVTLF